MTVDPGLMAEIAKEMYISVAAKAFGDAGSASLRRVLQAVRRLYERVSPEDVTGTLAIVAPIEGQLEANVLRDRSSGKGVSGEVFRSIARVARGYDSVARATVSVVEVAEGGCFRLFRNVAPPVYESLASNAVVYVYERCIERFYLGDEARTAIDPTGGIHASIFAIPTFRHVEAALEEYDHNVARHTSCDILTRAWESEARLVFTNKPECTMRMSLATYLRFTLGGDVNVREEQNVDASHPVDVRVTWSFAKRVALIEIKWLGKSRTRNDELLAFWEGRAREGARQLAEYLDATATQTPSHTRIGYLVVMDGRRRGVTNKRSTVTIRNAMYYEHKEIEYHPPYHTMRSDFAVPVRMFLAPRLAMCETD